MPAAARALAPPGKDEFVIRHDLGKVAVLTLNRPAARNSLSESMLQALGEAISDIAPRDQVRAVVIAANGPAFCAGHDLKEVTTRRADPDGGRGYTRDLMNRCSDVMQAIVRLPQPVIAAVEGAATAAGCQLVASCDLAVASTTAQFATPGAHIGLFCSTPMVALSRNIAPKHAMEMLLTGDMMSAEEAYRIGLVNRVVSAGSACEEALKLARKIAGKSAVAVRFGKKAFYRQRELSLPDAYRYAAEVMVENMMAPDAKEGIGAFVEKRDPQWDR
jgi:enoyl-CoA hydratase/carnithine racemase